LVLIRWVSSFIRGFQAQPMTDQLATSAHFDEVASLPLLTWSSGVEGL
jgi:hypothetical protein